MIKLALKFTLLHILFIAHSFAQTRPSGNCADLADVFGKDVPDFSKLDYTEMDEYKTRLKNIAGGLSTYTFEKFENVFYENVLTGDTNRLHRLLASTGKLKKQGVPASAMNIFVKNSLIFKGTVIGIDDYSDKCLRFKITYKVRVEAVYWADFDLKPGDVILMKDFNPGRDGGCGTDTRETGAYEVSEYGGLKLNALDIFVADKGRYARIIAQDRIYTYFQDDYCPSAFALTPIQQQERLAAAKYYKEINAAIR